MGLLNAPIFLNYMDGLKEIFIKGNKMEKISFSKITSLLKLTIEGT
jgi:hypothetical protein